MIFMSQSGLADPAREQDWDLWYVEHLRIMTTVPGISSAQRFKTGSSTYSPSLAMYTIASAAVFQDPYYQSVRGMGDWLPLIIRQHYRRNLFDGLKEAPAVSDHELLLVADSTAPECKGCAVPFAWLEATGLDRSTPYRGIAVVPREQGPAYAAVAGLAVYRPVSTCNRSR